MATFKDFIVECELFPYSKENYDLLKECKELELSEKYIGDQMFMAEAADIISDTSISFTEGFFQESVDDNTVEVLTEKVADKAKGIVIKIANGVRKLFRVFANFFNRIGNKFDSTTRAGQDALHKLNKATLTHSDIEKIGAIIAGAKNSDASNFPVRAGQPYASKIKLNISRKGDDAATAEDKLAIRTLRNDLAAALSDDTVVADVLEFKGERIGVLDPDDIYDAGMMFAIGKKSQIMNITKTLASSWVDVRRHGLTIHINTKSIKHIVEKLNKLTEQLEKEGLKILDAIEGGYAAVKATANIAADLNPNEIDHSRPVEKTDDPMISKYHTKDSTVKQINDKLPETAEVSTALREGYAQLTTVIGHTTKVYSQLNAYRSTVIKQLNAMLKDRPDTKEDKKDEKKEEPKEDK